MEVVTYWIFSAKRDLAHVFSRFDDTKEVCYIAIRKH